MKKIDKSGEEKQQPMITTLTWWLIGIAIAILIFSFVAPMLFTNYSSSFDFTQTGQIGDTLGGTMSPFIAIAGILVTFVAFYIQVLANKQQREQFAKELNKPNVDAKIESYYNLKLLEVDIISLKVNIGALIPKTEDWITHTSSDYYALYPLLRTPLPLTGGIDRLVIFKGFQLFLDEDDNFTKRFSDVSNTIDYIPKALEELYRIVDYHDKDTFERKSIIYNKLLELEKKCVQLLNNDIEESLKQIIRTFKTQYKQEVKESKLQNRESDFPLLETLLNKFMVDTHAWTVESREREVAKELLYLIPEILIIFSKIEFNSKYTAGEVQKACMAIEESYNPLVYTLRLLAKLPTIEDLRKEYDILPNSKTK